MHDFPRQKLQELINYHGTILSENAQHCEYFLREACGIEYKREVFALVSAVREGVAKELLNPPQGLPQTLFLDQLSQRLHDLGLDKTLSEWALQSWKMALLPQPSTPQLISPSKRLTPLNPLDYIRLLWWVLVKPQQLQAYRKIFGEEDENRIGKWLVSTLTWWPLLMPTLASGLELLMPTADNWPPDAYLWFSVLLIGCWLLTGKLGNVGEGSVMGNVAFGVVFSVVFVLTYVIAIVIAFYVATQVTSIEFGAAFVLAYVVTFYTAYVIAVGVAFVVKNAVTENLSTGTSSLAARIAFFLLLSAYLFLIWFCFFGGEQVLM
ncbi:MAG: hypothetical protein VSS75_011955 [Candidatus Parabeggiatoa sp.]|nr:hypothetical protein [Candidatus Parabeggiatoa sp.]